MKIKMAPYDPAWPLLFDKEKKVIEKALSVHAPVIEHIGSTSVPQLCAKPVIDILAGMQTKNQLDLAVEPMIAQGFTYFKNYEPGMPYRRLLVKMIPLSGKPVPSRLEIGEDFINGEDFQTTVHVHILEKDTYHWNRHLAFRDYLRNFPGVRETYGQLKLALSEREFENSAAYNLAKEDFIKKTQQAALEWWKAA